MMTHSDKRLCLHHVGGRIAGGKTRAFPILRKFEKDIINVLYEADEDCLAGIHKSCRDLESELHILPYCLGDACKSAHFNINYNPCTSSLRQPNPDYYPYYAANGKRDDLWSEDTTAVEKRRVEVVTLDYVLGLTNISIPPPDFLSIDAQGSEYEILLGAKETLKSSVLALVVEAGFHPIYKGQKLFGELAKLLSRHGFDFTRFLDLQALSPFRAPIGLRGEGFHTSSDTLFLKRIDKICNKEDKIRRFFMLRKLAFMAIVFNQFEYGIECLSQSRDLDSHHLDRQVEEPVYLSFLRDLEHHAERIQKIYPPTSASFKRSRTSASRITTVNNTGKIYKSKQLLRQVPGIPLLYLILMQIRSVLNRISYKVSVPIRCMLARCSDVEAVLIEYGLKSQANLLKRNRTVISRI